MRLAVAPPPLQTPDEEKAGSAWWSRWASWRQAWPASPPVPPPAPPPLPEPAPPPKPAPRADPITLLEWNDSPIPVKATVARAALRPCVGVRKDWGEEGDTVQLTLRADLQLLARLKLDLICKEAVLGGRLTASLPAARLEYRRRFKLPNGAWLALEAGLQHRSGRGRHRRRRFKPFLGCQLQFDSGEDGSGEVVVSEKGFSDTHRFRLPTQLGRWRVPEMELEAASTLSLPASLAGLGGALSSMGSAASLQSLPSGLPSPASLSRLGSAADLQASLAGPAGALGGVPSPPALPSLPGTAGGLPSSPSLPRLPSLPGAAGGLPSLPSLPRLPSLAQLGGGQRDGGAAEDHRALTFHVERLSLVLRV